MKNKKKYIVIIFILFSFLNINVKAKDDRELLATCEYEYLKFGIYAAEAGNNNNYELSTLSWDKKGLINAHITGRGLYNYSGHEDFPTIEIKVNGGEENQSICPKTIYGYWYETVSKNYFEHYEYYEKKQETYENNDDAQSWTEELKEEKINNKEELDKWTAEKDKVRFKCRYEGGVEITYYDRIVPPGVPLVTLTDPNEGELREDLDTTFYTEPSITNSPGCPFKIYRGWESRNGHKIYRYYKSDPSTALHDVVEMQLDMENSDIDPFVETDKCTSIFGEIDANGEFKPDTLGYWLKWGMDIIKYIAIVALLILSSVDFLKAMIAKDKEAVKKAGMTAAKRFVYAVLIFFLPVVIEIIMKQFGVTGTCGIEEVIISANRKYSKLY